MEKRVLQIFTSQKKKIIQKGSITKNPTENWTKIAKHTPMYITYVKGIFVL